MIKQHTWRLCFLPTHLVNRTNYFCRFFSARFLASQLFLVKKGCLPSNHQLCHKKQKYLEVDQGQLLMQSLKVITSADAKGRN